MPPDAASLDADRVVALLGLTPLPWEGGYFRETYRSDCAIPAQALPARYASASHSRAACTHIYFLLRTGVVSAMHLVRSDEVFHHYLGDPVEQLWLLPGGDSRLVLIGPDLASGHIPQAIVPAGTWQGARVRPGGSHGFALLGCSVSPGFDWADFDLGDARRLHAAWPDRRELIDALCPAEASR
ncbi:MAG: cupin domain-containing protein [Phycisphaerae bacterium]|jgi:predicted cupin superfamily sugar epimerase